MVTTLLRDGADDLEDAASTLLESVRGSAPAAAAAAPTDDDPLEDIAALLDRAANLDPAAAMDFNPDINQDINHLLIELSELGKSYGIRFPRSFTLLLKQFLYFDRYVQMLVPDMDIFSDSRIDLLLD